MLNWFKSFATSAAARLWELHIATVFTALALFGHFVPALEWYGFAIAVGFAAWKEFWFDPKYENAPVVWSGIQDFAGYCCGFVLTAILWLT